MFWWYGLAIIKLFLSKCSSRFVFIYFMFNPFIIFDEIVELN